MFRAPDDSHDDDDDNNDLDYDVDDYDDVVDDLPEEQGRAEVQFRGSMAMMMMMTMMGMVGSDWKLSALHVAEGF